jgi:hypothetical protein
MSFLRGIPQFSPLVTNHGTEVVLHNASLRWSDLNGECNYQGDVWLEQKGRTQMFRLGYKARKVTWLAVPSGKVKTKGDWTNGVLYLPGDGKPWEMTIAKRKSIQSQRKIYSIHLQFEANSLGLSWLQLSTEILNNDVSMGDLFRDAFVYAIIERCAEAKAANLSP